MSTIDYIRSRAGQEVAQLDGKGLSIGIAVAEWNSNITDRLLEGAIETLEHAGVARIEIMNVPGAFELTNASARLRLKGHDAVIAIGCVVRGDTPHFDYICEGVSVGISKLNAELAPQTGNYTPVIFCVLTTENMTQAEERAGGTLGNKGAEAAEAAIKMCRPICIIRK